jgi:hypothetical protein
MMCNNIELVSNNGRPCFDTESIRLSTFTAIVARTTLGHLHCHRTNSLCELGKPNIIFGHIFMAQRALHKCRLFKIRQS